MIYVKTYFKNDIITKIEIFNKTKEEIETAINKYENKDYQFEIIEDQKTIEIIDFYEKKIKELDEYYQDQKSCNEQYKALKKIRDILDDYL